MSHKTHNLQLPSPKTWDTSFHIFLFKKSLSKYEKVKLDFVSQVFGGYNFILTLQGRHTFINKLWLGSKSKVGAMDLQ